MLKIFKTLFCLGIAFALPCCSSNPVEDRREGKVEVKEAVLPVLQVGNGLDVLVLPDGPGWSYRYLLDPLSPLASTLRLTFFDHRYIGESEGSFNPRWVTTPRLVEDVEEVRKQAIKAKTHLLCHGWGCQLGLHYVLAYPKQVLSIVLVNPPPFLERQWAWNTHFQTIELRRPEEEAGILRDLVQSEGWRRRDPETIAEFFRWSLRPLVHDPAVVGRLDLQINEKTAENLLGCLALLDPQTDRTPWEEQLGEVDVPVLVVHGTFDPLPSWCSVDLAQRLPQGSYVEIEDVGHFVPNEAPEAFLAEVRRWFKLEN